MRVNHRPNLIENFGRNVAIRPAEYFVPQSEADVLSLLARHKGRKIRVIGRLHSWSEAAVGQDVVLDLRNLTTVTTESRAGRIWATIAAGAQIKHVLVELQRQAQATLPTLGLITEQSMAGAIATATHGSGRYSLSHFVDEIRIATYDPASGEPIIRTISTGDELRAARCSLGCLGVIVSVGLWCRPSYRIEEHFARIATLDAVLNAESEFPLQQFFLIPWSWDFYAQHRREVHGPRSRLAGLYRLYWSLVFDRGLHWLVQLLAKVLKSRRVTQFFFRHVLPWSVIRGWRVVEESQAMLTMRHELFRHVEIEMFVRRSRLSEAMGVVKELLCCFAGERETMSEATRARLDEHNLAERLATCAGCYIHHYPICIRQVLPDDTLLSMSCGDGEPFYAISFISYERPSEREGFFRFANFVCDCLVALFAARPHWGKVCPLSAAQAQRQYPRLPEFRSICRDFDASGVFRNPWVDSMLLETPESL